VRTAEVLKLFLVVPKPSHITYFFSGGSSIPHRNCGFAPVRGAEVRKCPPLSNIQAIPILIMYKFCGHPVHNLRGGEGVVLTLKTFPMATPLTTDVLRHCVVLWKRLIVIKIIQFDLNIEGALIQSRIKPPEPPPPKKKNVRGSPSPNFPK